MTDSAPQLAARAGASLRVLLADDHVVIREGLKRLLDAEPDIQVVGAAMDGEAACAAAALLHPDVLVVDLTMPVVGGIEATERVRRDCPAVKVLVLTVQEDPSYLAPIFRAGASGFVLKRAAAAELVHAVRAVGGGGTYLDPAIAGVLVRGYLNSRRPGGRSSAPRLSEREREVLVRLAQGYSNREIASDLHLSVKTIETYKARFSMKLGVRTRLEIGRYAAQHGLLVPTEKPGVLGPIG